MLSFRKTILFAAVLAGLFLLGALFPHEQIALAQQPTGSVPTVTSTPSGPMVRVDPSLNFIYVYAGPGSFDYPRIGVLLANETAPALGRAKDRDDWIQIRYPGVPGSTGWVYALYVKLSAGAFLPRVDAPPTPTPISTPTINPTLEAAFIGQQTPTRLPTFTPPPPLELPSFNEPTATDASPTRLPAGLLILSLALFGLMGAVISYLRGR
ncbi:MAG: SH3 domain-containing protein [Chloroflexota bacterium]|nr:SH3 domain-containing protein [Chloroflexota bacterium]MBI5703444.1 SH3 domain-containing protein [Chloroflexota bacterium]